LSIAADFLLLVNRIGAPAELPSGALLRTLFKLSPAETRLALELAAGLSLAEAGQVCGIRHASARTYLALWAS
jgi:hypothetical protein